MWSFGIMISFDGFKPSGIELGLGSMRKSRLVYSCTHMFGFRTRSFGRYPYMSFGLGPRSVAFWYDYRGWNRLTVRHGEIDYKSSNRYLMTTI